LSSSAEVPRLAFDRGQYTFATRCAACHTIGRGDHLGPGLLDVTARRDRAWLTRFIAAPEKMNAAGHPVAVALRARYDQVRVPNLGLSESEIAVVIDYIDAQSRAARTASNGMTTPR
jgi:protein SCO1